MMSYDLILTPLLKAKMGGRVIKVRLEVAVTVVSCLSLIEGYFSHHYVVTKCGAEA